MRKITQTPTGWTLCNDRFKLTIDRETGELADLQVFGAGAPNALWGTHRGYWEITDEGARKTFSPRICSSTLKGVLTPQSRPTRLTLIRQYADADFRLDTEYRLFDDRLEMETRAVKTRGADRTIAVTLRLPWPRSLFPYSRSWHIWAASHDMPMDVYDFCQRSLEYSGSDGGIMIPAFSLYNDREDVGLTFARPFKLRVPRLRYNLDRGEDTFAIEHAWMRLRKEGAVAAVELTTHAGDWRPALGYLRERCPTWFEPGNPSILEGSGVFWGERIYLDESWMRHFKNGADVGIAEVYSHFPCFGNYFSETEPWYGGRSELRVPLTHAKVDAHLEQLQQHGIRGLLYIQAQGDCERKFAENFPDSAIQQQGVSIGSDHYGVHWMNGDLRLSFGRHILQQARRMIDTFPHMAGFFVDQCCYQFVDTAHDDGMTMIRGRPAYMMALAYEPVLKRMAAMLRERNQLLVGNGPCNVDVACWLDGLMAESSDWVLRQLQYFGLSKPIYMFAYGDAPASIERNLKLAVEYAVQPGLFFCKPFKVGSDKGNPKWITGFGSLYRRYLPLIRMLAGRQWVFEPRAVEIPPEMGGNIFRLTNGRYAITLSSRERSTLPAELRFATVRVRIAGLAERLRDVTLQSVDSPRRVTKLDYQIEYVAAAAEVANVQVETLRATASVPTIAIRVPPDITAGVVLLNEKD